MLDRLKVSNFKAWKELDLDFGLVTGLFGTNSSGKSSILQFLLLLKQTKNATDRGLVVDFGGPAELVNMGGYRDVVHKQEERLYIDWTMSWTLPERLTVSYQKDVSLKSLTANELQLRCCIGMKESNLVVRYMNYEFANQVFSIEPESEGSNKFFLQLRRKGEQRTTNDTRAERFGPLQQPVKTHLFPDEARTLFRQTSLGDFESKYEALMDRIFYLGPLREHPQREYRWSGASPTDVGARGERSVDAILAATSRRETRRVSRPPVTRHQDRRVSPEARRRIRIPMWPFQAVIAHKLQELGLIHSFTIREIAPGSNLYHALVRANEHSPETMLTDVGFGVSQVLPALVLLYYVPSGSIVLMEQPEIHLHPSVQSGLADVMLDVANQRKIQIIVESHSEHLLRRMQRRAAEGRVNSSNMKLYFVGNDDGSARLNDLRLNEYGQIENWPNHFFGDEMGEISAITKASLKRRIGASR